MNRESSHRLLLKSLSHKTLSTSITTTLAFLFTQSVDIALSIGLIEALVKISIYFLHDRLWERLDYGKTEIKPSVIWFTGQSAVEKSTLSRCIFENLKSQDLPIHFLDNSSLSRLFPALNLLAQDSKHAAQTIGYVAKCLQKNGVFVVISLTPTIPGAYETTRKACKNFKEIHLFDSDPVSKIREEYQTSELADLEINTSLTSNKDAITQILHLIQSNQKLPLYSLQDDLVLISQ